MAGSSAMNEWAQIREGASEVEKLIGQRQYNLAMIKSRQTLEYMVRCLTDRSGIPYGELSETIDRLYKARVISKTTAEHYHKIRMIGNKAAHEGDENAAGASTAYHLLSQELYTFANQTPISTGNTARPADSGSGYNNSAHAASGYSAENQPGRYGAGNQFGGGYNAGNPSGGGYNAGNQFGGGYNAGNPSGGGYNAGNPSGGGYGVRGMAGAPNGGRMPYGSGGYNGNSGRPGYDRERNYSGNYYRNNAGDNRDRKPSKSGTRYPQKTKGGKAELIFKIMIPILAILLIVAVVRLIVKPKPAEPVEETTEMQITEVETTEYEPVTETEAPTEAPEPVKIWTTNDVLNVRSAPDKDADNKIGQLPAGTTVEFIEEVDDFWAKINYNGAEGYVAKQYLTCEEQPLAMPEGAEEPQPQEMSAE